MAPKVDPFLALLNRATAEALEKMRNTTPRIEFRSQADGHYENGCPILPESEATSWQS